MPSASELRQTAHGPLDPNVPQTYELRQRQQAEQPSDTSNRPSNATSAPLNENYEPNSSNSIQLSPSRQHILDSILRLYSGSGTHDDTATGAQDMRVYAKKSVYDDIASYCDTRYKIAGQWYGIPVVMKSSVTKSVEVVQSSEANPANNTPAAVVFKMKREWTPRLMLGKTFEVNHFVSLSLERTAEEDGEGPAEERVKYHKDQWNEKDYDHGGFGKVMKTVNGDWATLGTRPPKDL